MNTHPHTGRSVRKQAAVFVLCLIGYQAARAVELEGQIRGRVIEAATEVPVPGAAITVISPSLGEPRTTTTNENGEYLVPNLPIGHYTVTVTYAGIKPIRREITVLPGQTSPLDIKWSAELAEAETTTVVEERPITNPDSTQTGAVISVDQQQFVPTQRTYQDVVRAVPGVVRNNDVGNTREVYIKGGRDDYNRYLIDGLEITDPVARISRQLLPFDSVEAVQVLTSGFDAEYNSFGGVINVVTREGSDIWHGRASVFATNASVNNRRPEGLQTSERDQLFNTEPVAPTYSYIATASLGGPIIPHQFWFNATFEYRYSHTGKLVGPPLNLPLEPQINTSYIPRLKLTWAPSAKQRLTVSLSSDPQINNNTSSNTASNQRLGTLLAGSRLGGYNAIATWSYFPSQNFEVQLLGGIKTQYFNDGPMGYLTDSVSNRFCERFDFWGDQRNCRYNRDAATHVNQYDQTRWYGADQDYTERLRTSIVFDPKITWRGQWFGEHTAKIGLQLRFVRDKEYSHQTGDAKYLDNKNPDPIPFEEGLCLLDYPGGPRTAGCFQRNHSDDRRYIVLGYNPALFLQDHWRFLPWLTLTPGVRFEYGNSRLANGILFHKQFTVMPRMGLIADVTRDQKTILSTHYGRNSQVGEIGHAAAYAGITQGAKRQDVWSPAENRFVFQSQTGGAGGGQVDPNARVPHMDEIVTSIRREIAHNTVLGLEHTWRRWAALWNTMEVNQIWDPTGYRVIKYANGSPQEVMRYTTLATDVANYQGLTLSVEGRPTPKWYFLGFYTLSWKYGTADTGNVSSDDDQHRVPQQARFLNGFLPQDQRHQLNLAANYKFLEGFTVGTNFEFLSGRPLTKLFWTYGIPTSFKVVNRRSPRGTNPGTCSGNVPGEGSFNPTTTTCGNDVGRITEWRTPPRFTVDLLFNYDFYWLLHQHFSVNYEIFNVFNDRSATGFVTDEDGGRYGEVNARNQGLNMRFGARYDF